MANRISLAGDMLTFLFTDIEGSTRLWEQFPEPMQQAHARHGALIVACVEQYGGIFVRTRGEGDSTFSVFSIAADALAAACAFQRALAAEPWPAETPIRVRAALHTGTAQLRDDDYNSTDVNRCARLRAIAYGGQTILSQAIYDLTQERLPEEVTLKDLGLHRLKDLRAPEHVWQLCHPDLPADFPPLNSLGRAVTNLPIQPSSFIGQEREMAAVQELLSKAHLLTLTGAGGCGKTRLALQVAADLVETYPDGVWLVELAALSDGNLVPQSAASALGLREEPGRSLVETVIDFLRAKSILLLLDNCEHLVEACARLADLLVRSCPQVKILTTSREALNIAGEVVYRVPSLLRPDPLSLPLQEKEFVPALAGYDAVRLFIERAKAHRPEFVLTRQNGPAVAEVCYRLDGIPLAIEFAAARVRALAVEEINQRLDQRFRLLTGGSRAALPRHQTLRALIDWSYDLLRGQEKRLLNRLSVFVGGWTLSAAEQVGAGEGPLGESIPVWEVLDLLVSLVDKSLVLADETGGSVRYRMLETVRQYGEERLAEAGEAEIVYARHRDYCLHLAEEAAPQLQSSQQAESLERLATEHDNLRAALARCSAAQDSAEAGLRLAGALVTFWDVRGDWNEGRIWLESALASGEGLERTAARAKALNAAGVLCWRQGDTATAQRHCEECLSIYQELGDQRGISAALNGLGNISYGRGDCVAARRLFEQALEIRRDLDDKWGIAAVLSNLGRVALGQSDYAAARSFHQESLDLYRELNAQGPIAWSLLNLGTTAYEEGDFSAARSFDEQSLAIAQQIGDKRGVAWALVALGSVRISEGDDAPARSLYEQSLMLARELGDKSGIAFSLTGLGQIAYRHKDKASARALWQESLAVASAAGMIWNMAWALSNLGNIDLDEREDASARSRYEESLMLFTQIGNQRGRASSLYSLGRLAAKQGNAVEARQRWKESLEICQAIGHRQLICLILQAGAELKIGEKRLEQAARLYGASDALRSSMELPFSPEVQEEVSDAIATLRAALSEVVFNAAMAEGKAMTQEQAIECVLQQSEPRKEERSND